MSKLDKQDQSSASELEETTIDMSDVSGLESWKDSEDEDDLPDISLTPSAVEELKVGSLVWVKWKLYAFWPAVIVKLYCNRRKGIKRVKLIIIDYAPDNKNDNPKCVNRPFVMNYRKNAIVPLAMDCYQHVTDGHQSKHKESFAMAWRRVEEYLFFPDLSTRPSVWDFFGLNNEQDSTSTDPSALSDTLESTDITLMPATDSSLLSETSQSGDGDSMLHDDDDDDDDDDKASDSIRELGTSADTTAERDSSPGNNKRFIEEQKKSQLLIDYMTSKDGRTRIMRRLRAVERGKLKSSFKTNFDQKHKSSSVKRQLKYQGFGPICDFNQVQAVYEICRKFYSHLNPEIQTDLKLLSRQSYLLEVIMPEVIISSMTSVLKKSRTAMEKLFHEGPPLDCDER